MSVQRMHSDLSNERANVPSMRRIHSDIAGGQQMQQDEQAHRFPHHHQQQPNPSLASMLIAANNPTPQLPPAPNHHGKSFHQTLGGGKFADVVLWRKKRKACIILGSSTAVWFIFEVFGYTLIAVVANILLLTLMSLFAWAIVAALINRPPPAVPDIYLTDEKVNKVAKRVAQEVNGSLTYIHSLSTGKDFPKLLKTCLTLWLLSTVGQWFSLLTLTYLGILGALTLPLTYEKHEEQINHLLQKIMDNAICHYQRLDHCVLSKLPNCCK